MSELPFDLTGRRVFVAGHRGMVGGAVVRRLARENCTLLTASHGELDLTRQSAVEAWMAAHRPEVVVAAAARVGGILANSSYPAEFIYDNLLIEANLVESARQIGARKLLLLGSSCIYPRLAPQPIPEDALLTGPLEPTNQWYAIAKIAGIKLCQAYRQQYGSDFITAQPTNLYGPGDNFSLQGSHVIPALIRRLDEAAVNGAAEVVIWGSGTPLREFLHVDDLADALVFLLTHYSGDTPINIGSGEEVSIGRLASMIAEQVGFNGRLVYDSDKPDGTPRKLVDSSRLAALGWRAQTNLRDGLASTCEWYRQWRQQVRH